MSTEYAMPSWPQPLSGLSAYRWGGPVTTVVVVVAVVVGPVGAVVEEPGLIGCSAAGSQAAARMRHGHQPDRDERSDRASHGVGSLPADVRLVVGSSRSLSSRVS